MGGTSTIRFLSLSLRYRAAINIINSHQTSDAKSKFMTAALKIVMTLKPVLLIAQQGYSGGFGKCFFSLFFIPELLTKS